MADSRVTIAYVYPPRFEKSPSFEGPRGLYRVIFKVNVDFSSSQTNLADELVLDISTMKTTTGAECARTKVEWVECSSLEADTSNLLIEWDRAPQEAIWTSGPNWTGGRANVNITDPSNGSGDDGTGDIVFSTVGTWSATQFNFTLSVRLKEPVA